MKKIQLIILLICFYVTPGLSATPASMNVEPHSTGIRPNPIPFLSIKEFIKLTPRQYEKLTGRHLRFKEKIGLKLLQWKIKNQLHGRRNETKQDRQGRLSMIFGAVALATIFLPYVAIVSIPLAIAGLVLGIKSLNGNSNTNGILGVIFSSLVIFLGLIAIIFIAAFYSSWW